MYVERKRILIYIPSRDSELSGLIEYFYSLEPYLLHICTLKNSVEN